ncbi:MAG: hypothetical protein QOC82_2795 [Frankiaceae bacterium]|nr:hypothetical protein [Frankiaceae bacterium]
MICCRANSIQSWAVSFTSPLPAWSPTWGSLNATERSPLTYGNAPPTADIARSTPLIRCCSARRSYGLTKHQAMGPAVQTAPRPPSPRVPTVSTAEHGS